MYECETAIYDGVSLLCCYKFYEDLIDQTTVNISIWLINEHKQTIIADKAGFANLKIKNGGWSIKQNLA